MIRIHLFFFALLFCISSLLVDSRRVHKKHSLSPPRTVPKTNPTDAFCLSFIKQCYHDALHGKRGEIRLEFACERNGGKYSSSYDFGCKADNQDLTQTVLNQIGGGYTITSTQGSTILVTDTETDFTTQFSTTISEIDQTTTLDVTSTQNITQTNTGTAFQTITTISTTAIPITTTSTSISLVTTTIPVTSTVATSTITYTSTQSISVPASLVSFNQAARRKRYNQIGQSQFCSAYNTGCTEQCNAKQSSVRHVVCQNAGLYQYYLTCYCNNGKIETQHALAAVIGQEHISSVTTLTTSTIHTTVLATTVIPTTILSTSIATITSSIPITKTFTSSTTVTSTSISTQFTGTPTTVSTSIPISIESKTTSMIIPTTATTTTHIVVAPTGAVQAFNANDGTTKVGYLLFGANNLDSFGFTSDFSSSTQFAAIRDPSSGFYQLQFADGTGRAFVIFEKETYYYPPLEGFPSDCGSAGQSAGPPSGNGPSNYGACEIFVFGPTTDSKTIQDGTFLLNLEYYNPGSNSASNFVWINNNANSANGEYLQGTDNYNALNTLYGYQGPQIVLRYPYLSN